MPALGIDEPLRRVDADREDRGRVAADQEERALAEGDLAGEPHQQRQTDGRKRVQPHAVVERHVERRQLVRKPAGEHGRRREQPEADRRRPRHPRSLDGGVCVVRDDGDLGPRTPSDQQQHHEQRDDEAVLRVDVPDHELLEDAERVAAEERQPYRGESPEDGGGEAVDGDRDVGRVRHRAARREQRPAERAQHPGADEGDDRERARVQADQLGGAAGVGAGDQCLADDRAAQEQREDDRREERDDRRSGRTAAGRARPGRSRRDPRCRGSCGGCRRTRGGTAPPRETTPPA